MMWVRYSTCRYDTAHLTHDQSGYMRQSCFIDALLVGSLLGVDVLVGTNRHYLLTHNRYDVEDMAVLGIIQVYFTISMTTQSRLLVFPCFFPGFRFLV